MNNNFPRNLRFLRKQRKLTLRELATRTDVSFSIIGHWENGNKEPTLSNLLKLAKALEVSLEELVSD